MGKKMKKLVLVTIVLALVTSFAVAEGFGISVKEFVEKYNNYSYDKPLADLESGTVFGSGDTQFIRIKAETGVEIFLGYSQNTSNTLTGIVVMQSATNADFERFISVCQNAAYIVITNLVPFENHAERVMGPGYVVADAIAQYAYLGRSGYTSTTEVVSSYEVSDETRKFYLSPKD